MSALILPRPVPPKKVKVGTPIRSLPGDGVPPTKLLSAFAFPDENDPNELLKTRFLCRGGGMLLVGPTGIGKSAFTMQCMMLWAAGQSAFGIDPVKPLKTILVQAENDEGDLAEFRDGIIRGLGLDERDARMATENVIVCTSSADSGMSFCEDVIDPLLGEHKPDLLVIDPALAYLGGESNSQQDVGEFLRLGLNPLIQKHGAAALVVHHTNKPPSGKEKGSWSGSELSYLGAGSAEWANWARAIMAIRATGDRDLYGKSVFELCAPKRGGRLRWQNDAGEIVFSRKISHSRDDGVICWHALDDDEVVPRGHQALDPAEQVRALLDLIPKGASIEKSALIEARPDGMGQKRARQLIDEMLESGQVIQVQIPRPGARPRIEIALNDGTFEANG